MAEPSTSHSSRRDERPTLSANLSASSSVFGLAERWAGERKGEKERESEKAGGRGHRGHICTHSLTLGHRSWATNDFPRTPPWDHEVLLERTKASGINQSLSVSSTGTTLHESRGLFPHIPMDLGTALRPQWVGSGRGRSPFDLYPYPVFIEGGRAYSQVRIIRLQLGESSR